MANRSPNIVVTIFDDLEEYLKFCREFGYRYNEAELYNWNSYAYQQYSKFKTGKNAKNMWGIDRARFKDRASGKRNHSHKPPQR